MGLLFLTTFSRFLSVRIVLTTRKRDVGASPELLGVGFFGAAESRSRRNPVLLVGGTRAGPRGRVELVVPDALARVTGVLCYETEHEPRGGVEDEHGSEKACALKVGWATHTKGRQ